MRRCSFAATTSPSSEAGARQSSRQTKVPCRVPPFARRPCDAIHCRAVCPPARPPGPVRRPPPTHIYMPQRSPPDQTCCCGPAPASSDDLGRPEKQVRDRAPVQERGQGGAATAGPHRCRAQDEVRDCARRARPGPRAPVACAAACARASCRALRGSAGAWLNPGSRPACCPCCVAVAGAGSSSLPSRWHRSSSRCSRRATTCAGCAPSARTPTTLSSFSRGATQVRTSFYPSCPPSCGREGLARARGQPPPRRGGHCYGIGQRDCSYAERSAGTVLAARSCP